HVYSRTCNLLESSPRLKVSMTQAAELDRKVHSVNPATGGVLREFDSATAEEVNSAVERARSAQQRWREVPISDRLRVLRNFQRALYEQKTEVAAQISAEAGKPQVEALLTEVLVVLDAVRFYLRVAKS